MDSSKRDIYDLIAELAKSANIEIHGTEFDVPSVEAIMRTAASEVKTEITKENSDNYKEVYQQHIVDDNLSMAKTKLMEQLMKANSIEELKALQGKQTLDSMVKVSPTTNEPSFIEQKSGSIKFPSRIGILPKHKNGTSRQQASSFEEFFEMQSQTSNSPKNISKEPNGSMQHIGAKQDMETINSSVPNSKTAFNEIALGLQHEVQVSHQLIHSELKQLNEKLDRLDSKEQTAQIITELKKGDERVFDQVVKTREFIMQDFARMEEAKSIVAQSYLKWLGILNLFLLILIAIYLLFQKFNALSQAAHAKQPYSKVLLTPQVETVTNQQDADRIDQQASPQQNSKPMQERRLGVESKSNRKSLPSQTKNNKRVNGTLNTNSSAVQSGYLKNSSTFDAVAFTTDESKVAPSTKPIANKINTPKEEVFFGED